MGHAVPVVARIWRAAMRVTLFFLIWTMAVVVARQALGQVWEHQRLSREVGALQQDYAEHLDAYAEQLAENERIASDEERQVELLKQRFGYTEPDETPIIILKDY